MLFGTVLTAVRLLIYVVLGLRLPLVLLFALQIIFRIEFSATFIGMTTISTDTVPQKRMTDGIAYFRLASTISMAIGPNIALYFIDGGHGYGSYFSANVAIFIVAITMIFVIRYEKHRKEDIAEGMDMT